jgi:hypothetical protein
MAGVSLDSGGPSLDVATVLAGGDAFLKRLEAWQQAKDAHDQAYARLGLGQDAAAERDRAARMVSEAQAEAEAIRAQELEKATAKQKTLNEFIAQAQAETSRAMEAAQRSEREANAKLAAANENHAASLKALSEANEKLEAARGAHAAVQAAQAALAKAL